MAVCWATGPLTSPVSTTDSSAAITPMRSLGSTWASFSLSWLTSASTVTRAEEKRERPQTLRLVTPGASPLT